MSRLLDALREQALITKRGRIITDVDWPAPLRVRAESRNLLKVATAVPMIAPLGQSAVLQRLRDLTALDPRRPASLPRMAVTGTAAAVAVAPVAAGGQLMLYVDSDPEARASKMAEIQRGLGLLRGDSAADVLLLSPDDPVIFTGMRTIAGTPHVALSQLVLDCLAGPGRMPAEGEELLAFMERSVDQWRLTDLEAWAVGTEALREVPPSEGTP